jgi:hypothetical protein
MVECVLDANRILLQKPSNIQTLKISSPLRNTIFKIAAHQETTRKLEE